MWDADAGVVMQSLTIPRATDCWSDGFTGLFLRGRTFFGMKKFCPYLQTTTRPSLGLSAPE